MCCIQRHQQIIDCFRRGPPCSLWDSLTQSCRYTPANIVLPSRKVWSCRPWSPCAPTRALTRPPFRSPSSLIHSKGCPNLCGRSKQTVCPALRADETEPSTSRARAARASPPLHGCRCRRDNAAAAVGRKERQAHRQPSQGEKQAGIEGGISKRSIRAGKVAMVTKSEVGASRGKNTGRGLQLRALSPEI